MKIAQDGIDEIIFITSPEGMLYPRYLMKLCAINGIIG
jgi:hypothetical protein